MIRKHLSITLAEEEISMSSEQPDQQPQSMAETSLQDEQVSPSVFAVLPTITMLEVATLLDFSPEALVIIDAGGTIVLVNEQAAVLFGYSQKELLHRPLELLLPERFHVTYAARRLGYMSTPRPQPMGTSLDLVGRRKDGSELPLDISIRPVLLKEALHVVGAVRDVSTQRRLERELLQQMEQLVMQGTLINLAHDAIIVRDQISRILSWNHGAAELYGWS